MPETHKKIAAVERDLIALLKSRGTSNKEIARRLGRHPTSIGLEINRNQFRGKYYVAIHAQAKTDQRKLLARKDNDTGLYWYEYLRRKQKKRKKQTGRSVHKSHIPDRISIHKRPKEVEKRKITVTGRETPSLGKEVKTGSTLLTSEFPV